MIYTSLIQALSTHEKEMKVAYLGAIMFLEEELWLSEGCVGKESLPELLNSCVLKPLSSQSFTVFLGNKK